jgi:hypothetical protein
MKPYQLPTRLIVLCSLCMIMIAPAHQALAWTEHPLIAYQTLSALPEVRDAKPIQAEELDAFLKAEEKGLANALAQEEAWARQNLAWYMPLPDALAFKATGDSKAIRQRFCHAIRINPDAPFALYLQLVPGMDSRGMPFITPELLTILKNTSSWKATQFVRLSKGDQVLPLSVVVTATDEPDFGLDIGLYADNDTAFGRIYGFGKQPFGNPHLEYGSQAPFHMGFYHEAWITNSLAGFVKQTYPEYRIHLYQTLSQLAFKTGHSYWGWRFMGIGLHYIIDLTQPYHTTLMPGASVLRMLWINTLSMVGIKKPKTDAIQLLSNRHMALEKLQQALLEQAYRKKNARYPVFMTLRATGECPGWTDRTPRDVISAQSNALADRTDKVVEQTMPAHLVSDPAFELGTSPELDQIVVQMKEKGGAQAIDQATILLKDLLTPLPAYMCSYVRSVLKK